MMAVIVLLDIYRTVQYNILEQIIICRKSETKKILHLQVKTIIPVSGTCVLYCPVSTTNKQGLLGSMSTKHTRRFGGGQAGGDLTELGGGGGAHLR